MYAIHDIVRIEQPSGCQVIVTAAVIVMPSRRRRPRHARHARQARRKRHDDIDDHDADRTIVDVIADGPTTITCTKRQMPRCTIFTIYNNARLLAYMPCPRPSTTYGRRAAER